MEETGLQVFARLVNKPDLSGIEPCLFSSGPEKQKVYEIYGEDGKTELVMHFVLKCIMPKTWNNCPTGGYGVSILYFDLDCHLSLIRLASILESKLHHFSTPQTLNSATSSSETNPQVDSFVKDCLQRLQIIHCYSSSQLLVTLHSMESFMSNHPDVCVIVLDSVSAFYWADKAERDIVSSKQTNMDRIVEVLKKIIVDYNLVCFATKPVLFQKKQKHDEWTSVQSSATPGGQFGVKKSVLEHCEFLPRSWQGLVHRRFYVEKCGQKHRVSWTGKDSKVCGKIFCVSHMGVQFID